MKKLQFQVHKLNLLQISIIILIAGLLLGVLSANLFRDSYFEQMADYQNTVFVNIAKEKIDYSGLFAYVLRKNFKELAVFWLLSITILGIPYMVYKIAAFGFSAGFFISAVAMQYGFKGIIFILVYEFPHGLIYLPVALLCLYKGFNLCKSIYYDKKNYMGAIKAQLKPYFLLFLLLIILVIAGSFLEAYAGSFFLKKALGLFT
jgi:stage II sporulation protein M